MLPLLSVLFDVSDIATVNETGIPFDVLVASLSLFGTIISRLNCTPRIPLAKALLSVIIEAFINFSNCHENILLHTTPYPRARETVTSCPFTTKGVL